jgi:hypothetical protein
MASLNIKEELIDEYIKRYLLSYKQLDKYFYHLPKALTKIIWDFGKSFCDDCENCCKTCKFYCALECLRENNRKVCCIPELKIETRKYNNNNNNNNNNDLN